MTRGNGSEATAVAPRTIAKGDLVGFIPAGGRGARLRPFSYPKELLPIGYDLSDKSRAHPRLLIEFALKALAGTGARRCIVVIAPWKCELLAYIGSGEREALDVAYVCQEHPRSLVHAIDLAYGWLAEAHVALVMPDTMFEPADAMAVLSDYYCAYMPDLLLGVFPTEEAARLGPVVIEGNRVLAVYDKEPLPPAENTWGCALWGPRLTELIHSELARQDGRAGERVLGEYFNLAVQSGLRVEALSFPGGNYHDLGTPEGIRRWIELASPKTVVL